MTRSVQHLPTPPPPAFWKDCESTELLSFPITLNRCLCQWDEKPSPACPLLLETILGGEALEADNLCSSVSVDEEKAAGGRCEAKY